MGISASIVMASLLFAPQVRTVSEAKNKPKTSAADKSKKSKKKPARDRGTPGDTERGALDGSDLDVSDRNGADDDAGGDGMASINKRRAGDETFGGSEADSNVVDVPRRETASPEEMLLEEALQLSADVRITGKSVSLVDVLSGVLERQQQIDVTKAYWKLSAAVARYNFKWQDYQRLEGLVPPTSGSRKSRGEVVDPELEAQLASMHARLRESEAAIVSAQYDLAEAMRRPTSEPLPLPTDLPHARGYTTNFKRKYVNGNAPPLAARADRLLPLRRRSLEVRAAAVQAGRDAADALEESYLDKKVDLGEILAALRDLSRQQQEFVEAVQEYNAEIATYALTVAPASMSRQSLVGLLIRPSRTEGSSRDSMLAKEPGDVERTSFNEPTLADPREEPAAPGDETEHDGDAGSDGDAKAGDADADDAATTEGNTDADEDTSIPGPAAVGEPRRRIARKLLQEDLADVDSADAAALEETALYSGLEELPRARRAVALTDVLHWDRALPTEGTAVTLRDCLVGKRVAAGTSRNALIHAFWTAREEVARYQVLSQQVEQLRQLRATVVALLDDPRGPEAGLAYWAARRSAEADLAEAHAALLSAQFELTRLARGTLPESWLVPSTVPHAGGYYLRLDQQSKTLLERRDLQRLAHSIPRLHEVVQDGAAAVIAADVARAASMEGQLRDAAELQRAIGAIQSQAAETLAFLADVTRYNQQIADYVLVVVPASTDDETLVGALVLRPKSTGS